VVFLLDNLGLLDVGELFFGLLFGLAGLFFLSVFISSRENWWALIPGFTLLSLGLLITLNRMLPGGTGEWGGAILLGGIALSFLLIYIINRENWWAIIPGGVLLTLALIVTLSSFLGGFEVGGLFFLGIGLTFALVAALPNPQGSMVWAWIPAGILMVMGLLVILAAGPLIGYVWPVALILVGLFLFYRGFARQ
jgi:hypothetical protein